MVWTAEGQVMRESWKGSLPRSIQTLPACIPHADLLKAVKQPRKP